MRHLFLLALLYLSCGEKATLIVESPDTPDKAFALSANQRVTGKLYPGKNTIYFRIRLAEAAMLRGELAPVRGADTRLELLSEQGDALYTVDDNGSSLAEEIFPVLLSAGDYLLRIAAEAQTEETFTVFYRLFKAPPDIESEPNNTLATASMVAAMHATGFFGPELYLTGTQKERERDCFAFTAPEGKKRRAEFSLSGVDGYRATLHIFDSAGKLLVSVESVKIGERLLTEPLALPEDGKLFACVTAQRKEKDASRDYYELQMQLTELQSKAELEPNNTVQTASVISGNTIEGTLSKNSDVDYFYWQNTHDYALIARVELESRSPQLLRLESAIEGNSPANLPLAWRIFENSAEKGEVADNLRVETGEKLALLVRCRKACQHKNFVPVPYVLRLSESQATDENEAEPNDNPERAETLLDLTQKWGFINPPDDNDYFRLRMAQPAIRDVLVESKLGCRLSLEHWRGSKLLFTSSAKGKMIYNAEFTNADVLRLKCLGKAVSPDRSYLIVLSEP